MIGTYIRCPDAETALLGNLTTGLPLVATSVSATACALEHPASSSLVSLTLPSVCSPSPSLSSQGRPQSVSPLRQALWCRALGLFPS
jgi:hypothetical protein